MAALRDGDSYGMARTATTAVVACAEGKTNGVLVARWRELGIAATLLSPAAAAGGLGEGDSALVRLDVLQTLDGIEPGLEAVDRLAARGVRVLNTTGALRRAHDKLETARALQAAGLAAPRWTHLGSSDAIPHLDLPVVVKPRFGSWGRDVTLCKTPDDVERCIRWARGRRWFERHGALIERYVPSRGVDRRVLVAAGHVVGRVERVAAPGEWRTNVSLGGTMRPAPPAPEADALAVAAAEAVGTDLAGVDLIQSRGEWLVIELNGAVDFDAAYSLEGGEVFADIAAALSLTAMTPVEAP